MPRSTYTEALVGPELYKKIRETPVLVVGAGGIGCELRESSAALFEEGRLMSQSRTWCLWALPTSKS